MTHRIELIILNLTRIKDSAAVIHTLSREFGRRSFITGTGAGSRMAALLPLSIVEAEIVENRKSDLWRARNITSLHPLFGIRDNIYKNSMTLFMSEVLFRTLSDGAAEEGLFEWCRNSILTLDAMDSDFSNFHLRFLLELAGALGFAPSPEDLLPFSQNHYASLKALSEGTMADAMMVPLNGESRNEMADILLRYISYHSESAINVRSLKVLRELFS